MDLLILSFLLGVVAVAGPLLIIGSIKIDDADENHKEISTEDMEIVLDNMRVGASRYERQVIDAINERIGEKEEGAE